MIMSSKSVLLALLLAAANSAGAFVLPATPAARAAALGALRATAGEEVNARFPLQNDLMIRAAKGEPVERTPIWLFRQAGR